MLNQSSNNAVGYSLSRQEASLSQFSREFKTEYQPLISLSEQHFIGFEAILTWQQQRRELYSNAAIEMIEETGLSVAMRSWLLRTVIRQLYFWNKQFLSAAELTVSLQLSEKQWLAPCLPATLQTISQDFRWCIRGLVIEIGHGVLNRNVQWSARLIARLQDMGIQVQVCSFVPTHSALATLDYFKIKTVKIDQAFIHNLTLSWGAQRCFDSVLQKLRDQAVQVTVPYIESPEQVHLLTRLNCQNWRAVCATPISPREATLLIHADSKLAQSSVMTYLSAMNRLSQFVQQYLGLAVVGRYWKNTCPSSDWLSSNGVTWRQPGGLHAAGDFCLSSGQIRDIEQWVQHFMTRCSRIIRDLPDLLHASGLTLAEAELLRLQEP